MSVDIRLVQQNTFPAYEVSLDWVLLSNGTLDSQQALASAVIVAIGTDRLAAESDILPDPDSTDRRGWWGDLDAEEVWNGWEIGSRLWLLKRDKIVGVEAMQGSTVMRVKTYIMEAIQPFLDRRIASRAEVWAERNASDRNRIDAALALYRGPFPPIELRFEILWDQLRS